MREQFVGGWDVRLWVGVRGRLPAKFGAEAFRVDHQQHQSGLVAIKRIRYPYDLLRGRAMDEPFLLQAGGTVLAGLLSGEPVSTGSEMQDQGSTS